MMHSSVAVETPPLVSAPPALVQARMSPNPVDVSMMPLPLRSLHWPFSSRPTWTTLLPSRFVFQTLPLRSTVVRDGSFGWPLGDVKYSPITCPVAVLILTIVPLEDTATHRKSNSRAVWSSCNWFATSWMTLNELP